MPATKYGWPPRRILVGYDRSEGAMDAVALCAAIAPPDAYVAVIDVLPGPSAPSSAFRLLSGADFEEPKEYFAPAVAALPGREVEPLTYFGGSPARIFEQFALEHAIDLIVVGSPHHRAVGRVLAGSVSQALLHGAPVPVATAPQGYADRAAGRLGTVAVAYDGAEESQAALGYAAALTQAAGADLEVLTVERPTSPVSGAIAYTLALPQDVDDIQRQAIDEIDPPIPIRRRVLEGPTAEALADACREDVDLIVVGSRGYGMVERALLGSTSTTLINEAPCPVLVVPRASEHVTDQQKV
jgi:nucleotide-binding universal stress UspA family protein